MRVRPMTRADIAAWAILSAACSETENGGGSGGGEEARVASSNTATTAGSGGTDSASVGGGASDSTSSSAGGDETIAGTSSVGGGMGGDGVTVGSSGGAGGEGGLGSSGSSGEDATSGSSGEGGLGSSSGAGGDDVGTGSSGGSGEGGLGAGGAGSGGEGPGGGACGGETCRADQSCIEGQCVFACDGVQVPGDYVSVQSAVTALYAIGGTICVRPGTYAEDVTIDVPYPGLVVRGASAESVTIDGRVTIVGSSGALMRLEGLAVTGGVTSGGDRRCEVEVTACRITNADGPALRISSLALTTVDGCDLAGSDLRDVVEVDGRYWLYPDERLAQIRNSYLHGGVRGVYIHSAGSGPTRVNLHGNTFLGSATAVETFGLEVIEVSMFGGVFTDNGVGIDIGLRTSVTQGNNAVFGNAANYAGYATPGPGYVTSDCMLDDRIPPSIGAGSPCRDAADPTVGVRHDYYRRPRGDARDIGAVEAD